MSKIKIEENLYFNQKSSTYFVQKYINGHQYFESTKVRGLVVEVDGKWIPKKGIVQARQEKSKILLKWSKGEFPDRFNKKTFDEYFDVVLLKQKAKAKNTYDSAHFQIEKHLRPWFSDNCSMVRNFDDKVWAKYCLDQSQITPGRKLEHDRRHLIMALRIAFEDKSIDKIYTKRELFLNEGSETIGRLLDDWEIEAIINSLPKSEMHTQVQVLMALFMGMRKREILHLSIDEINIRKRTINLIKERIKTRKGREVQIHDLVWTKLKVFIDECVKNNGKYIFPFGLKNVNVKMLDYSRPMDTNKTAWISLKNRSGVKCRFHDLKHTYIGLCAKAGIPPMDVCKMVGTKLETVMNVYHHTLGESKEKAKAIGLNFIKGKKDA